MAQHLACLALLAFCGIQAANGMSCEWFGKSKLTEPASCPRFGVTLTDDNYCCFSWFSDTECCKFGSFFLHSLMFVLPVIIFIALILWLLRFFKIC